MFEIGRSLREARTRRGLELDTVQRALRIRRRYLEALEADRFELVPGEVYARGFLREYAEFLGLDGALYVEEYNARFAHRDELPIAAQPSALRLRRGPRALVVALAVLGAIAVAGAVAAWQLDGSDPHAAPAQRAAIAPQTVATPGAPTPKVPDRQPRMLTLTAARGNCWVGVRLGSAAGPKLYWRTLKRGDTIKFALHRSLWVRVGVGRNLDAKVGTQRLVGVPSVTGTLVVRA